MSIADRIGKSLEEFGEHRVLYNEARAFLDRVQYLTDRGIEATGEVMGKASRIFDQLSALCELHSEILEEYREQTNRLYAAGA